MGESGQLTKKTKKNFRSPNFSFFRTYCVTNSIKLVFKYELEFVAFTWPYLCLLDLSLGYILFIVLVGRNFVSVIYKLKLIKRPLKNLKPKKTFFLLKPIGFPGMARMRG